MKLFDIIVTLRRFSLATAALFAVLAPTASKAVSFAESSRLSSGHWVKVKVSETGIQQISHDQLRELGLDPEKTSVYGIGASSFISSEFTKPSPDDLVPTYSEHTPDGRLLFYGEGPAHYDVVFSGDKYIFTRSLSQYSGYSAYFLTDSEPVNATETRAYSASGTTFDTHLSVAYVENEQVNPFSVGAFMWDKDFSSGTVTQDLKLKDFATAGVPVNTAGGVETVVTASLCNGYVAQVNSMFSLIPSVPEGWVQAGEAIDSSIFAYITRIMVGQGKYTMAVCPELNDADLADYDFVYESTASSQSAIRGAAYTDYRAMIYPRHNYLSAGEIEMLYLGGKKGDNVKISAPGAQLRVWNISDLTNIYPHAVSDADADGTAMFTFDSDNSADAAGRYIAFDASAAMHSPEIAGDVANQNLHAAPATDLLIITTNAFRPLAEELAQYHRDHMGQDVLVATQEEVFNEFSSGAPSAPAFRLLAKMLYDRYPGKFRNLLFYGCGHWDNRHLVTDLNFETLVTYQTEAVSDLSYATAYVSDSYFGMLSDSYRQSNIVYEPMLIGVGRIPATSASDAKSVNSKILRYMTTRIPTTVANSVLIASDAGDDCQHFKQAEEACGLLSANRPELTLIKAPLAAFVEDNFGAKVDERTRESLVSGVALYGYSGHGNQDGFYWNKNDNSSTSYDYPPFVVLSTCDPYAFHHLANSMAECMLYKEDGGAIGVVGAMCSVYLPYNQFYYLSVLASWSTARPGDTFGDVMRNARRYMLDNYRNVNSSSQVFTNAMCYNFCGDPALAMPVAAYGAAIEKVDGKEASDNVSVLPRVPVILEGVITNADGTVNTGFNGKASLMLYEAPYEATTRVNSSQTTSIKYTDDASLLAQTAAEVSDGRFTARLVAPQPQITGAGSRLVIAATNADNEMASGVYTGLAFGLTDETTPGQIAVAGPTVTDLYFDRPGNGPGACVGTNSLVSVCVDAPAGLNTADSNIGYKLHATVDGVITVDRSLITVTPCENNRYVIAIKLKNLTEGHHELMVALADNCLQRTDAVASFTVGKVGNAGLVIDESALPARESVVIDIESDVADATSHRLIIENAARQPVFVGTVTFPYEWKLTDTAGEPVAEGFYSAYAISSGSIPASTPKKQIIVIR